MPRCLELSLQLTFGSWIVSPFTVLMLLRISSASGGVGSCCEILESRGVTRQCTCFPIRFLLDLLAIMHTADLWPGGLPCLRSASAGLLLTPARPQRPVAGALAAAQPSSPSSLKVKSMSVGSQYFSPLQRWHSSWDGMTMEEAVGFAFPRSVLGRSICFIAGPVAWPEVPFSLRMPRWPKALELH